MTIIDWVLLTLWAILASACVLNWTAQARWHKRYAENLESIRTGAAINCNIKNMGKVSLDH